MTEADNDRRELSITLTPASGEGFVAQLSPTEHRTIVVVDVADFTNPERNVADLLAVQEGVYAVLETAFGRKPRPEVRARTVAADRFEAKS